MSWIGVLGDVYKLLAIYIIVPSLVAIVLVIGSETELKDIECWLLAHKSILTSVGTVVLVSGLALGAAIVSSRSAESTQKAHRDLSAELKLSDFRQNWINVLREDLAEIVSISYVLSNSCSDAEQKDPAVESIEKLRNVEARVRMRLNPGEDEKKERELEQKIVELINSHETEKPEAVSLREEVADLGARFLKDEWEVLKDNLHKIQAVKPGA